MSVQLFDRPRGRLRQRISRCKKKASVAYHEELTHFHCAGKNKLQELQTLASNEHGTLQNVITLSECRQN